MWESELANAQLVLTRPHIIALTWADFYTTEEYSIESTCRKADSQCKALQPSLIPLHWVVRLAGRVFYGKVVSSYKKLVSNGATQNEAPSSHLHLHTIVQCLTVTCLQKSHRILQLGMIIPFSRTQADGLIRKSCSPMSITTYYM